MEKIKIKGTDQMYEITEIRPITNAILRIVFVGSVPAAWGDIILYTAGGEDATTLRGYDTVYRDEGQTVYMSNDGSVYTAPENPEEMLPPDPYIPSLEELQASKRWEISASCEKIIYDGVDVTMTDGNIEHYSLTEHDQLNLFGKQSQILTGATQLEYHADGQPCRYYSAADMQNIVQSAMWHVSYHTTYCNAINMWVKGCNEHKEVQAIFYGADVPEAYQSDVLKAYLIQIANMAEDDDV